MVDTKLSVLSTGTIADYYYGIEGTASKKYTGNGIINVKDYGAVGDNSHDDATAIQAAFDAAFGTAASPHGNGGGYLNKPVYFPPGRYKILTPLVITAVWGGRIYGAGLDSSIITFSGTIAAVNGEGFCPVLWANGCNNCYFEGFSLVGTSDPTNHRTVGIWFGPDGANGGSSAHGNTLVAIATSTTSYGVIHGSTNSAANSENTYIGCYFGRHEQVGLFISGANSLNMRMIGGGSSFCGVAGIKTNNSATIPVILNPAFDNNYLDIDLAASSNGVIEGIRSESANFVKTNSTVTLINCGQAAHGGAFTATTTGTTLNVSNAGTAVISLGMAVYGTDTTNSLPTSPATRITAFGTGTGGNGSYTISAVGVPGDLGSCTMTVRPVFCELVGAALVEMAGCSSAFDPAIIGASNSVLRIHNNAFYDQNANAISTDLFKYYAGQVFEYDVAALGTFVVAGLPTANARFKGVRMFVTDSTVAGSGNFGAIVAGTSTNAVPVYCDGTNWRIG